MFLRYAFLADLITLDITGKANAIGIFDIIAVQNVPVIQPSTFLLIRIEGNISESGQHNLTISLRNDKGEPIGSEIKQNFSLEDGGFNGVIEKNIIISFRNIPFNKLGRYEFVLFADERFLGRVNFLVKKVVLPTLNE
jgi:hypothetical protein